MTSLLTRTSRARCHIRFGCVTLALVVTLTHNPRWVVTNYFLAGFPQKGYYLRVWRISGFCGYGDSVEIPTGFSVGMGWVWALKFHPHGSPAHLCIVSKHLKIRPVAMLSVQCLIVFSAWSTTSRTGLAL